MTIQEKIEFVKRYVDTTSDVAWEAGNVEETEEFLKVFTEAVSHNPDLKSASISFMLILSDNPKVFFKGSELVPLKDVIAVAEISVYGFRHDPLIYAELIRTIFNNALYELDTLDMPDEHNNWFQVFQHVKELFNTFSSEYGSQVIDNIETYSHEEAEVFVRNYLKLREWYRLPPLMLRVAFFETLAHCRQFVYKGIGIVDANGYIEEFDALVKEHQPPISVMASMNDVAGRRSMLEWSELNARGMDINLLDTNWNKIANHVEAVAKSLGWDGQYSEEQNGNEDTAMQTDLTTNEAESSKNTEKYIPECPHCKNPFDYGTSNIECPHCNGIVYYGCENLVSNFDSNALYFFGGGAVSCDFGCEIPEGAEMVIGVSDDETLYLCTAPNHAGIAFETPDKAAYIGRKRVAKEEYGIAGFFSPNSNQPYSYEAKQKAIEAEERRQKQWKGRSLR